MFTEIPLDRLACFGFKAGKGGTHAARTMMLPELRRLLDVAHGDVTRATYRAAVIDANALDKPTVKACKLTLAHLADLYGLGGNLCLFRALRQLWHADPAAQPVLALQLALARDTLLRTRAALVLDTPTGHQVTREAMGSLTRPARPDQRRRILTERHLTDAVSVETQAPASPRAGNTRKGRRATEHFSRFSRVS
jgi:hypothetical protein